MIPKTRATLAAMLVVATPSPAAFADALYDEIRVCRSLPSEEARLACYDAAADRARAPRAEATATPPTAADTPAPPATEPAAAAVSQEELFGKNADEVQRSVEEATGAARIESLRARITDLQEAAPGKLVISLDNGQVWRQTTTSNLRLSEGDEIEIERAALGSYMLQKAGSKRTMRVQRVD